MTRAGTNTPSDEYDSYREYRVANTNIFANTVIRCIHSRILLTECASEEEVLFGKYMWVTKKTYIIHIKTETPIKCVASMGATI